MKLKIIKLIDSAILPKYAHDGDAGLDLFSSIDTILNPGEIKGISTGIALELPKNTEAQIRPRSGLALSNGITVLNSPGTIDSGYRGEVRVILINHSNDIFHITIGMKIAQMVISSFLSVELEEVKDLNVTSRGANGFGSTGIK